MHLVEAVSIATSSLWAHKLRSVADVFGLSKQPSIITNVDDFLEFQKRKRIT